ncbi:hypothetical protein BKA61DRAFT_582696 [Leptodontidium sp. MPI-SDFR-AT-0119]|nr:hypothetical protein BKA61DRAFT_582696 [Leptodontidium sp. MPI-SDFR-AT-0119]
MQFLLRIVTLLSAASVGTATSVVRRDCSFKWVAEKGNTCLSMATDWGLTQTVFINYNPGVVCPTLLVGTEYCVEWTGAAPPVPISSAKPTTTSSTTISSKIITSSTTTEPSGPSPTQVGIIADCTKFHLAVSGDTFGGIVSKYGGFTLNQLYAWNSVAGNDCSGLWLG